MIKHICDHCGTDEKVGRVTLDMAVSQPHKSGGLAKGDGDLCPMCLQKLISEVHLAMEEAGLPSQRQS